MFLCSARLLAKPFSRGSTGKSFQFNSASTGFAQLRSVKNATQISTFTRVLPSRNVVQKSMFQMNQFLAPWRETALFPKFANFSSPMRSFAVKTIKVPPMADSITEGTIQKWLKKVGESVQTDELVAQIETDKVVVDIRAPEPGVIVEQLAPESATVLVGAELYKLDTEGKATVSAPSPKVEAPKVAAPIATPPKATVATPPPIPKQEALSPAKEKSKEAKPAPAPLTLPTAGGQRAREERKVPMSRMRARIAERLKAAQNTYALLTTFNEVDMSNLIAMRELHKDEFNEKHGIKLGYMSAFVKASAIALTEQPNVNAVIDDKENCIVYRDYVDISVAVATENGLVVPVVRDCDALSFADIEKVIAHYGKKARDGQIAIEDMAGGTFTISNGGVYGSMMGTPIVNPPQSAILGMHAITKRAVVINDQIVIRPMMYVALTYDHRMVDGKDAVTFLKRIKELIEDPRRMLLA